MSSRLLLQPHWQMMGALEAAHGVLLFGISARLYVRGDADVLADVSAQTYARGDHSDSGSRLT
jgi:hypothetical protein